jgi:phospholipase C
VRIVRMAGALTAVAASIAGFLFAAPVVSAVPAQPLAGVPQPAHVVVVVMENHSYNEIIGSPSAPYINSLASGGAKFTQSFAVTHPSEPNYLALFSGSTQGLINDSCPHTYSSRNLGQQLIGAGRTFIGYSESMPSDGYTGCISGQYARKHNPWVNFTNVPSSSNLRFSRFPTNYSTLPSVSFVIPNLCSDMHDCGISTGDTWLKNNINGYALWAKANNSLLVLTFDEDDSSQRNQIATVFYGQHVKVGSYSEHITHYNVLRTVEDAFSLPCAANSCSATPITDIWQ